MKFKTLLNEQKKPSKSDVDKLVKAYALMKYSKRQNAPLKTQQKYHDAYNKVLDTIAKKYPELDTSSSIFDRQLEQRADKYWKSQAMRGAGKDW